jgi:hypothetical protein
MDAEDLTESSGAPVNAAVLEPPDEVTSGGSDVHQTDEGADLEPPPWWWPTSHYPGEEVARRRLQLAVGLLVAVACGIFVFWVVHPELVFRNTTPTGGDMGAHVWGPAYLRDHLLPSLRLTGWSPDWYAGFPAFEFYMVVPALMIVWLNVGFLPWWMFPLVAVAFGWLGLQARHRIRRVELRWVTYVVLALVAVGIVHVPYNVAFKLVVCLGIVTLPGCVWFFGRSLDLRFGGPELMAIATLPFLVDESLFHIYGGNIASTMAGEFAFSISLSFAFLFLGVVARGLKTGRHAALGSVLFAMCALCHVIPFFFATAGAIVLFLLRPGRKQLHWLAITAIPGGLLTAFWYVPFYWNSTYMNDMGWEKLGPYIGNDGKHYTEYLRYLLPFAPHRQAHTGTVSTDPNMLHGKVFFVLAVVGIVLSLVLMVRVGVFLTIMTGLSALAFWLMPQARFWNARVLPFYYLCIYLLAALGVWLAIRAVVLIAKGEWAHPPDWAAITTIGVVGLIVLMVLGVSMREMPGGAVQTTAAGTTSYKWGPFTTTYAGPVRGWAEWNFTGLEGKAAYPEFKGLIDEMKKVGATNGCGRSLWEYGPFLDQYGTPMAPMLLPYFTNGCIGSQEAVYFESSSTTPFHFIMQDELSKQCSCAQRFDIFDVNPSPYRGFDLDAGIDHLQMLGVKYYLAYSPQARAAAAASPRLKKVGETRVKDATTGKTSVKWQVYEVKDVNLAEGLDTLPAVWTNVQDNIHSWAKPAVSWFEDKSQWGVQRASSGPANWPRVAFDANEPKQPKTVPVEHPAKVSNIVEGHESISFDVDQIGKPVLVRTSYFPNWKADGATGPYRVAPNQMVVVPTSKHVVLRYTRSPIELISMLLSLIGVVLLFVFHRRWNPGTWDGPDWVGDRHFRAATDGDPMDGEGDDFDEAEDGTADPATEPAVVHAGGVGEVTAMTVNGAAGATEVNGSGSSEVT